MKETKQRELCRFLGVLPDWKIRLTNIKKTAATCCLIVGLLHHIASFRANGASVSDRLAMMVHMVRECRVALSSYNIKNSRVDNLLTTAGSLVTQFGLYLSQM